MDMKKKFTQVSFYCYLIILLYSHLSIANIEYWSEGPNLYFKVPFSELADATRRDVFRDVTNALIGQMIDELREPTIYGLCMHRNKSACNKESQEWKDTAALVIKCEQERKDLEMSRIEARSNWFHYIYNLFDEKVDQKIDVYQDEACRDVFISKIDMKLLKQLNTASDNLRVANEEISKYSASQYWGNNEKTKVLYPSGVFAGGRLGGEGTKNAVIKFGYDGRLAYTIFPYVLLSYNLKNGKLFRASLNWNSGVHFIANVEGGLGLSGSTTEGIEVNKKDGNFSAFIGAVYGPIGKASDLRGVLWTHNISGRSPFIRRLLRIPPSRLDVEWGTLTRDVKPESGKEYEVKNTVVMLNLVSHIAPSEKSEFKYAYGPVYFYPIYTRGLDKKIEQTFDAALGKELEIKNESFKPVVEPKPKEVSLEPLKQKNCADTASEEYNTPYCKSIQEQANKLFEEYKNQQLGVDQIAPK